MIHFLIYEYLKKKLAEAQNKRKTDDKTFLDFAGFMLCGACSKTCATIVAYPHGKTFITFTVTLKQTFEQSFRLFWICAKNFDFYTTKQRGEKSKWNEKDLRNDSKNALKITKKMSYLNFSSNNVNSIIDFWRENSNVFTLKISFGQ